MKVMKVTAARLLHFQKEDSDLTEAVMAYLLFDCVGYWSLLKMLLSLWLHSILGEMYAVLLWLNSLKRHLLFFLFSAWIQSHNSSVPFAINRSRSSLWLSHCLAVSIICSVEVKSQPLCARSVAWAYLWCWVHFISYMDPYFSIVVKVSYRVVFKRE